MPTQNSTTAFALLGHAINRIQDRMDVGEKVFAVPVTRELATDDCFLAVLAGYIEDSAYSYDEIPESDSVVVLRFSKP